MKRKIKRTLKGLIAFLLAMSLSGCSSYIENPQTDHAGVFPGVDTSEQNEVLSMEEEPVIAYTAGTQLPGILVAQVGYSKEGDKVVIFRGSKLPKEYRIYEKETGRKVYTGRIEQTEKTTQDNHFVGYGDFSSFMEEGNYYVECDTLGRSYHFQIKDGLYTGLMEELLKALDDRPILQAEQGKSVSEAEIITQCKSLAGILLAVELFPDSQLNKVNGLENKTPDVLEYVAEQVAALTAFQDAETGGVGKASAWYCAVLTKFSYSYRKYDSTFATKCLQAADKAWKYIDANVSDVQEAERFFAATELYRATEKYRYHTVAKELGKKLSPDIYNEAFTYGGITYISTKWNLDKNICNIFIKDLMDQAETISINSKNATYLSGMLVTGGEAQKFFQQMLVMCVVDYVITNQEYAFTIERHHLYLGGRNEEGNSFLNYEICDTLSQVDLLSKPEYFGRYYLMLSEMMSHE